MVGFADRVFCFDVRFVWCFVLLIFGFFVCYLFKVECGAFVELYLRALGL